MKNLTGKSIVHIFQKTLNLLEPRLTDHGRRVTYILRCMLEYEGSYSKKQLDRYLLIGLLHDIGAYKTDEIDQMLTFDCENVWSHSIYGYLYLCYLSPLKEEAAILLYHHLDYNKFGNIEYENRHIAMYLNIADRVDILLCQNHGLKNLQFLEKYRDTRFSGEGIDLLYLADKKYHILDSLNDDSYKEQLEYWTNPLYLKEEDCKDCLRLIAYSIDFRSEKSLLRIVITSIIAYHIALLLQFDEMEKKLLSYASLVYDIGMLGIPHQIISAPRKLDHAEQDLMRTHVRIMETLLDGNMDESVIRIAKGHHEKLDGSGYPHSLKGSQIDKLQRTLAIADIISALSCGNNRRIAYDRKEIINTVTNEALTGKLDIHIVKIVTQNLDSIMEGAIPICDDILKNYRAIKEQFAAINAKFKKFNQKIVLE